MNAPIYRNKLEVLLKLLEQNTSLEVVSNYLKHKKLTFSAPSWEQMIEKRIKPALEKHELTEDDLIKLLRDAEECGHQHVQLWTVDASVAKKLIDQQFVHSRLTAIGKGHLIDSPDVLDLPSIPTLTDVRWVISGEAGTALVLKVTETRYVRKVLRERQRGNIVAVFYSVLPKRTVNVAKLNSDGVLELRIASHTNSTAYRKSVVQLLLLLQPFLLESDKIAFDKIYNKLDLGVIKGRLWSEKEKLSDVVRSSDLSMRNDNGNVMKASTGKESASLSNDSGVLSSINSFMEHDGYCDSSNFWFVRRENELVPTKDIHVQLTGEINEFILTARCTPGDYNYVLRQIRLLNS
ncbi:hypothetical protein KIF53_20040 [Chromobacterium subtsugae]|uniref:Uncharacterized protein n=1 Tax=Chromobacterium subtsugae TaxID=251747 RepID=A0ABS7FIQ2_9NEIS|nr:MULTISPECIES: hypothetical protein [Chromobacterium]MBW7568946.1 hypothetical protein [Chromobacterium subtsugae]MBW8289934.1 hypothetical protein [Chromobacterium subtsugae]WSE92495.1 hypothetical protein U6115_04370 [Chromobacterium subtsugae]WVH60873.1 hypothetical protein U6151_04390 [Chromobacterium subtsugae]